MLSLQSYSAPLDIERLSVLSFRGEPLKAVAIIRTEADEQIRPECLFLGDESDLPFPDYPLLSNARITLSSAGDVVEISTAEPLISPGVAIMLKVQCPGARLTARHFNLLIRQPWDAAHARSVETARADARGTRLTVLHNETVASIARSIHPTNAAARRLLERAIVVANPDIFPHGKPLPLQAGTRLVLPDLRDAMRLAGAAAQPRTPPAPMRSSPAPVSARGTAVKPRLQQSESANGAAPPTGVPLHKLPKKLKLALARSELNLKRTEGIDEARRNELRRLYRGQVVEVADAGTEALELRIAQLRESQSVINSHLARLEQAVEALRQSIAAIAPSAPPALKPSRPAPEQVAPWQQMPWMPWAAAAAGSLLLAVIAFMFGRRTRSPVPANEHGARIEALLQEARDVAGPLLESQPATATPQPVVREPLPATSVEPEPLRAAPSAPAVAPPAEEMPSPAEPTAAAAAPEPVTPLPQLPDFLLDSQGKVSADVDLELEAEPVRAEQPAERVGVKIDLRMEMDLALDNSRSMFTDVDRFIALGRMRNAISLLEFEIQKDPNDRDSWVKLMAVYRHEGMEVEFQRTFAEFKRKFPGEA